MERRANIERKLACLCCIILLAACDDTRQGSTAAPSPFDAPASGVTRSVALSGIVTVEGRPLAGATVGLLSLGNGSLIKSTVTDANGAYRLTDVANVSLVSDALMSVSKADYFTITKYVQMFQDQTSDFALERAAYISIGDQIQGRPGDARCASLGYGDGGGAICRRFAVKPAASGTLDVLVSPGTPSPFDGTILRPDGTIGVYGSGGPTPLRLALEVQGGLTYQIDVVPIDFPEFTLTTALR
jgi:hypothetical protein